MRDAGPARQRLPAVEGTDVVVLVHGVTTVPNQRPAR